ncbi:sphingosine hydroxylase [Schizosaccharomyces japonicus yFS275]|uniref:Sphingosine hydroxylase n=1 Tax=Schizosaccharomyces japonicus (strain yFS275 / FY16936) TaxID=402676 RepID=B6K512_SCHJY|nr:sphingosine hydroxylase [Schizosaccharomyces japonicus yFS275]EEB08616.2 sphingosine hydroxylase [Schizosaccharomyces japonicus yFS275]
MGSYLELITSVNDVTISLAAPVIAYWVASGFFGFISWLNLPFFEKYRLHTPEEIAKRNRIAHSKVIRAVLFQQFCEVAVGLALAYFDGSSKTKSNAELDLLRYTLFFENHAPMLLTIVPFLPRLAYYALVPGLQFFVAFFIIDTWQYFWHRYLHSNKALYNMIHAHHHRLYVPYATGALYNHPFEGLILDTFGAGVAYLVAGLTPRQSIIFFTLSTLKTVDDHCGYVFPWDPLQIVFTNNARYHDLHHQPYGFLKNYSQPYFTFWDHVLGTYMAPIGNLSMEERKKLTERNGKKAN